MSNLKHPIVMFIVPVLVVIAIGVGIVAATQISKVYGPAWAKFSVAFSGPVCSLPLPIPRGSAEYSEKSPIYFEASSNLAHKCAIDWPGYAPLAVISSMDSVDVYSH